MAKSKRAGRMSPARETAQSRHRSAAGGPADQDTQKRAAPRAATGPARDRTVSAMEDPRDDGLDEWLAPDEDDGADLDQWLHDLGMDGDREGPGS